MGLIKIEAIIGYVLEHEVVCKECATDEEEAEATEEQFIESDEKSDAEFLYFCDRCKKRIEA